MERTEQLISLQICVLRICGVWPKWKKPFRDCVIASVGIIIYSALIWIFSLILNLCVSVYWPYKYGLNKSSFSMSVRVIFEVAVRISVIHLGVCKGKTIHSLIAQCGQEKQRIFLLSVVFFLVVALSLLFSLYPVLYALPTARDTFRVSSITGAEGEVNFMIFSLFICNIFHVTFLPSCLVLTFSCSIANKFKNLKSKLALLVGNKLFFTSKEDHLAEVKQKFFDICNLTSVLDTVFRHYISTVVLSMGVTTVTAIYLSSTVACADTGTYLLTLTIVLLGLLVLCTSGDMITSAVSRKPFLQTQLHSLPQEVYQSKASSFQAAEIGHCLGQVDTGLLSEKNLAEVSSMKNCCVVVKQNTSKFQTCNSDKYISLWFFFFSFTFSCPTCRDTHLNSKQQES